MLPREEKSCRTEAKSGAGTGLYYYGARYYDPSISLWLSVDPLAIIYPHVSPYAYVFNNPIMYIDPTGMVAEPPVGLEQIDGTMHSDADGTWKYNKSINTWEGQDGAANIENAIQLAEVNLRSSSSEGNNISKYASGAMWTVNTSVGAASAYTVYKGAYLTSNELWHRTQSGNTYYK